MADEGELDGALRYQDRVNFVHRVDPTEMTVTQQVGFGRAAQTVSTTVEEPGERAVTKLPERERSSHPAMSCTKPIQLRCTFSLARSLLGARWKMV